MWFSGLGQPVAYTEEALAAKLQELEDLRAEREAVEAEVVAVRSGRPIPPRSVRAVPSPQARGVVAPPPPAPLPAPGLPGGSINLPFVGEVPVLVVAGAAVAGFFAFRRK